MDEYENENESNEIGKCILTLTCDSTELSEALDIVEKRVRALADMLNKIGIALTNLDNVLADDDDECDM